MKKIVYLIAISFVLHLIWENAHAPLYSVYESFIQHFVPCFIATFGDITVTLSVYGIVSLPKRNTVWITDLNIKDIFALAVISFFIAVWIEQYALFIDKWGYTSSMPLIPYFDVGLTPILQMVILLPLSVYLTGKFVTKPNPPPNQIRPASSAGRAH
ncbi:MAG: hypothetical protein AAB392_02285 [Patescibacteria group bacterium]